MIGFYIHDFLNFENIWVIFILFRLHRKRDSNIGVGYIIPKTIVYVEIEYDFTKISIKVLASSSLSLIVLLFSFNLMHSL